MIGTYKKYIFSSETPETFKIDSNIEIKKVTKTNEFKDFFRFIWSIYKRDKNWVPPIWQEINNFFKTTNYFWKHAQACLFLAYKNDKIVGRIAVIIDNLIIKKEKKNIGYFGFFEVIDDYKVAQALFDKAIKWLKYKNITKMRGPIDARIDIRCGLLLNGYNDTPFIFASYNPKYYVSFVEIYGMKKCRDQLVYYLDLSLPIPQYLKEASEKIESMGVKIRGFKRLKTGYELRWWIPMMKKTFSFHWGYVDVTEEEVKTRFGIKQIKWIVDPGLFLVAESAEGEPIAFKWSTPDFNQTIKKLNGKLGLVGYLKFFYYKKKINRGRFNFVGIKKEWQGKNLGSAMNYWTMVEMKKRNYCCAECGWIDEKNITSQKTIEKTGAKLYKKYRVYEIDI